jgi:DNA-binding Lrp family transcriptional regulator
MKLTRRQEEFVVNLIELNRELDGPIHYSTLAERLGVSPFTAYDMLCVLEEKGMVSSKYQRAAGKSGPGRAERLFCPVLPKATGEAKLAVKNETAELDEVELKRFLMKKLRSGDIPNKDAAEAILARIPRENPGEVGYCMEVMTIMALRLRESKGQEKLLEILPQLLPGEEENVRANLTLLGGIAFGLLVQEDGSSREWSQMLLEHVRQYQEFVVTMTAVQLRRLAELLIVIFKPLNERLELEPAIP